MSLGSPKDQWQGQSWSAQGWRQRQRSWLQQRALPLVVALIGMGELVMVLKARAAAETSSAALVEKVRRQC